jgi:hypothetical protein
MNKAQLYSNEMTPEQKELLIRQFSSLFEEKGINKDNFKVSISNNAPPKIVYHYTSLNALQTILHRIEDEEKKCSENSNHNFFVLRGTHIEFLNDISEFRTATRLMADLLEKHENSLAPEDNKHIANRLDEAFWRKFATFYGLRTPPFITSFSENRDSLPMWKTYGQDGKGVAIGIERIEINESSYRSKSGNPVWVRCTYDSNHLKANFSEGIKSIYKRFEISNGKIVVKGLPDTVELSAYFSMLKNFAFEYEQEWRLVKEFSSSDLEKEIHFYEKDGMLKPYIEYFLPKEILKEIVIGPCSDLEILQKSLRMSLKRAGYSVNHTDHKNNFVEIISSEIPYRNL